MQIGRDQYESQPTTLFSGEAKKPQHMEQSNVTLWQRSDSATQFN